MTSAFRLGVLSLGALSAALVLHPPHAAAQTALQPTVRPSGAQRLSLAELDDYIEKAREEWQVPGAAVVIVKDDKIVYAKGFGVREIGKSDKIDPDTVFAIGSASKAFTGATMAMLVDDKKITWDGVVHDYMPAFELNDPYVTNHATVRDLLAHRTGFNSGYGWLWTGSGFNRKEIIDRVRFQKNLSGFRDKFLYANEMFTVAGEVVPTVTGTSWDDFVIQRLFTPLRMTRSSTSITKLKGMQNVASPHGMVDDKLVAFPYRNVDNVGGAGSINSTARDLAQWVRMQLNDGTYEGKELISKAAIDETHSGQTILSGRPTEGKFSEYGFGWMIHDYRGKKVIEHGGAVDGMRAGVAMMPEEKLGIVVLTNMLPHQLVNSIEMRIYDTFLGGESTDWSTKLKAEADAAKALSEEREAASTKPPLPPILPLAAYAGIYTSELFGDVEIVLKNGALHLTRPTAEAQLTPQSANLFKARWTSASILSVFGETPVGFSIGPAGDVVSLNLGPDRFDRKEVDKK